MNSDWEWDIKDMHTDLHLDGDDTAVVMIIFVFAIIFGICLTIICDDLQKEKDSQNWYFRLIATK